MSACPKCGFLPALAGEPQWLLDDCRKYEAKLRTIVGILRENARLVDEEGDTTDDIEAGADCLAAFLSSRAPAALAGGREPLSEPDSE